MNTRYFFTSLTRISNLRDVAFQVHPLPKEEWARGDYVVGEVTPPAGRHRIELDNGRMIAVAEGDLVVGAFGKRFATLEATGDWRLIGSDGAMDALTGAGLFGKLVSLSTLMEPPQSLRYRGHVLLDGKKARMQEYVTPAPARPYTLPTVLLVGTSMSAGKTTAARIVIRQLKRKGLRVVAAKLAGAARYRDILTMGDAGADHLFDFVDVGLPSTICPADEYRGLVRQLLAKMSGVAADVAVVELGASPLEPYNGDGAIAEMGESVRCRILCASDPYAVVGVMTAFGSRPHLVTGAATNTEAGVALVGKLAGVRALNILEKEALPLLAELLEERLGLEVAPVA